MSKPEENLTLKKQIGDTTRNVYIAWLAGSPTQRAPDVWESARFQAVFLA